MLAGKDEPEDQQVGIEDALLDVVEQVDPGHVVGQREVLQGQVEKGEGEAQGQQGLLQQVGAPGQQADPAPEPPELHQDNREEDGLQGDPDFGEAAVLVDGHQPDIDQLAQTRVDFVHLFFPIQVNCWYPRTKINWEFRLHTKIIPS